MESPLAKVAACEACCQWAAEEEEGDLYAPDQGDGGGVSCVSYDRDLDGCRSGGASWGDGSGWEVGVGQEECAHVVGLEDSECLIQTLRVEVDEESSDRSEHHGRSRGRC